MREGTHLQINAELWLVGDASDNDSGTSDQKIEQEATKELSKGPVEHRRRAATSRGRVAAAQRGQR